MKKRDFRKLCIYDLCDDPALLKKILVIEWTRDEYLAHLKDSHPARRALDMVYYADEIGDTSLREEVISAWGDELSSFYDE